MSPRKREHRWRAERSKATKIGLPFCECTKWLKPRRGDWTRHLLGTVNYNSFAPTTFDGSSGAE